MSSLLMILTALAGIGTITLGIWHLGVPRWFAFPDAIGVDGHGARPLPATTIGPWRYQRSRRDVLGLSWVMSNAASYVLITIGIIDLTWAFGDRTIR